MVEYMRAFLEPFEVEPYSVKPVNSNWYRVTNIFSGFSVIIRGYRGEVFERVPSLDDDGWQWKRISVARLRETLGICEARR